MKFTYFVSKMVPKFIKNKKNKKTWYSEGITKVSTINNILYKIFYKRIQKELFIYNI